MTQHTHAHDYVTIESFIDYVRDVRCLVVGDEAWAMTREGAGWQANVDTVSHALIEPPPELVGWTQQARRHFEADALGLDYLETPDGDWVLLESNDPPGFFGFAPEVPAAIARLLLLRIEASTG